MTGLAHDPLDGTGKYRATKELGRGGMGEVFLAEHIALGSQVVVKLLHAELASKNTLVDRMRIEAQACARLNHPNIVRVTDFDRTPSGRPYFVMEYLPGQALGDVATSRGGFLPVAEAVDIVLQALDGLSLAHSQGLVHRDIKLDNLFLCEASAPGAKRLVKILDFGVAKVLDGAGADAPAQLAVPTGTGVVVGTPRFFAPEQARGKALDARADIYAMGLVLYSLVAGRGPFDEARNITEMAKAHVFKAPEPPSHFAKQPIPDKLDAVVLRAIAKKPEQRFQSATEMAAMLTLVAEEVAGGAAPPSAPENSALASTAYMPPASPATAPHAAAPHAAAPHAAVPHAAVPHAAVPHAAVPQHPPSAPQIPAEITGSEAPTNRMAAHAAHAHHAASQGHGQPHAGAHHHGSAPNHPVPNQVAHSQGGYPPAPSQPHQAVPAARPPASSQSLPGTAPFPGSTQLGAAQLQGTGAAPAIAPVGSKRYSTGLAAAIVLIALLLGGVAAAAVLRML